MSAFRSMSKSTKFTTSPAPPPPSITNSTPCRRRRRAFTAPSTCWGWRSGRKHKILQASTSEVYGDALVHPQGEDYWGNVNPIGPRSCYDEGKRCAETLFFDYWRQHRLPIKVARIFNTYGPRMHPRDGRVVSNFIVQALGGKDITIYGDGSQTRSFCYVDDLVDGLIGLMGTPVEVTGPVNLGNPVEFSIRELAETIIELTGSSSRIVHMPLPIDDPRQRRPDISKANELFDWAPTTPLRAGLERTVAYFERLLAGETIAGRGAERVRRNRRRRLRRPNTATKQRSLVDTQL